MSSRTVFTVFLFLATGSSVLGVDHVLLSQIPPPAPNFRLEDWLGDWYLQAFYVPCSWKGAKFFTDYRFTGFMDGNGITETTTWRNRDCSTVKFRYTPLDAPGRFIVKDPIGDVFSGYQTAVVVNSNAGFAISMGCTKLLPSGNACADPWVSVKSRRPFLDRMTTAVISRHLMTLWKLSLNEMTLIPHQRHQGVSRWLGNGRKSHFVGLTENKTGERSK